MKKWRRLMAMMAVTIALFLAPLGAHAEVEYPWFTYGNFSNYSGGNDDIGLKFDGYVEQGADLYHFPGNGPVLNAFVGLNGTFSNKSERWWDNSWGPALGVKLKFPVEISEGNGGNLAIGIRGEHIEYAGSSAPSSDDNRLVVFAQWYLGGTL